MKLKLQVCAEIMSCRFFSRRLYND